MVRQGSPEPWSQGRHGRDRANGHIMTVVTGGGVLKAATLAEELCILGSAKHFVRSAFLYHARH